MKEELNRLLSLNEQNLMNCIRLRDQEILNIQRRSLLNALKCEEMLQDGGMKNGL